MSASKRRNEGGGRRSAAAAALGFGFAAPCAYALLRAHERLTSGVFSPGLVLRSTHSGFLWRAAIAAWLGGLVALAVHAWVERAAATPRTASAPVWVGSGRFFFALVFVFSALALAAVAFP